MKRLLGNLFLLGCLVGCAANDPPATDVGSAPPVSSTTSLASTATPTPQLQASIPAPPMSTISNVGEDPDLKRELDQIQRTIESALFMDGFLLNNLTIYQSPDSTDEIVAFYMEEMNTLGWSSLITQTVDYGIALMFRDDSMGQIALIEVIDPQRFDVPLVAENRVLTAILVPNPSSLINNPSVSPITGFDLTMLPEPPENLPINEGEDPVFDELLGLMDTGNASIPNLTTIYYKSAASVDELAEFYSVEAPLVHLELTSPPQQSTEQALLQFQSRDGYDVLIVIFDTRSRNAQGNLVMIQSADP